MKKYLCFAIGLLLIGACKETTPNENEQGVDILDQIEYETSQQPDDLEYHDLLYVPIYSDIYVDSTNPKNLLAATLSIRNTSSTDTIFISKLEYYNTDGDLVHSYLDQLIAIPAMATLNYVIDKDDDRGGNGANFLLEVKSNSKKVKPLVQAVMIGQYGNKGFAFSTDAYSIK